MHLRKHNSSRPTPKKIPSPFERRTKKRITQNRKHGSDRKTEQTNRLREYN